jgi:hypothetical protein
MSGWNDRLLDYARELYRQLTEPERYVVSSPRRYAQYVTGDHAPRWWQWGRSMRLRRRLQRALRRRWREHRVPFGPEELAEHRAVAGLVRPLSIAMVGEPGPEIVQLPEGARVRDDRLPNWLVGRVHGEEGPEFRMSTAPISINLEVTIEDHEAFERAARALGEAAERSASRFDRLAFDMPPIPDHVHDGYTGNPQRETREGDLQEWLIEEGHLSGDEPGLGGRSDKSPMLGGDRRIQPPVVLGLVCDDRQTGDIATVLRQGRLTHGNEVVIVGGRPENVFGSFETGEDVERGDAVWLGPDRKLYRMR